MIWREVVFAPEARDDLMRLHKHLVETASPSVADRYLARLQAWFGGFAFAGERGTRRDDVRPGLRVVGFERRITAAFTVDTRRVVFLRVFYGGQDWSAVLSDQPETTTLWRPVGPNELALIEASGFRTFPPRLPEQPIFYPVANEAYAVQIARDWNVKVDGAGFVTRFEVRTTFLDAYPIQQAGGRGHLEYWIPAPDLPRFNASIVGMIEVVAAFR
jgi:plasmid stabilization system protein ParE